MAGHIKYGQMIGECVEYALWLAGGAYVVWVLPRHVHRDVQSGKITEEQARKKLKMFSPMFGYLVMIAAAVFALYQFLLFVGMLDEFPR
jgi:hypothetical protein